MIQKAIALNKIISHLEKIKDICLKCPVNCVEWNCEVVALGIFYSPNYSIQDIIESFAEYRDEIESGEQE